MGQRIQINFLMQILLLNIAIGLVQAAEYIHKPNVGMYYKFYSNPQTWFNARITCNNDGGELAMPKNANETAALIEIFETYPKCVLTGVAHPDYILLGFHDFFNEGEYITLNGEAIQYHFHTWAGPQPDNLGNEDCGSLHKSGFINDFPCAVPGVFICQKREENIFEYPDSRCHTIDTAYHFAEGTDKCYKLHLDPRNWADARAICQAEGSHLAIIRNQKEEEYLVSVFNKPENRIHHVVHQNYALLGFHDIFQEGQFVTVLDEKLNDIKYVKWARGQPDSGRNENCGSMTNAGLLNDFPCSVPAVFFCEREGIHNLQF